MLLLPDLSSNVELVGAQLTRHKLSAQSRAKFVARWDEREFEAYIAEDAFDMSIDAHHKLSESFGGASRLSVDLNNGLPHAFALPLLRDACKNAAPTTYRILLNMGIADVEGALVNRAIVDSHGRSVRLARAIERADGLRKLLLAESQFVQHAHINTRDNRLSEYNRELAALGEVRIDPMPGLQVIFNWSPHSFLKLGHFEGVDDDGASCFCAGGAHSSDAGALALAANTVVCIVRHNGQAQMRAWGGICHNSRRAILTNFYYRSSRHKAAYKAAISYALSVAFGWRDGNSAPLPESHIGRLSCYNNGNAIHFGPTMATSVFPQSHVERYADELNHSGTRCAICDNHYPDEDMNYVGEQHVCEHCLNEYYVYLDYMGEYAHNDDVVMLHNDEYALADHAIEDVDGNYFLPRDWRRR